MNPVNQGIRVGDELTRLFARIESNTHTTEKQYAPALNSFLQCFDSEHKDESVGAVPRSRAVVSRQRAKPESPDSHTTHECTACGCFQTLKGPSVPPSTGCGGSQQHRGGCTHRVPDGVELAADDLVEALEQAVFERELAAVHLLALADLVQARAHHLSSRLVSQRVIGFSEVTSHRSDQLFADLMRIGRVGF